MIGQTISHYHVLEKLGEGGMGVVYKARDTKLDRDVALKFLPDSVENASGEMDRFVQEAKAAAALNHPNICTVYGIDEADGKHFIAMEFVDGQSLQVKKASLNMKQALDIAAQTAEGLAAAHEKGIVHRDMKPENIMIRRDGRAQIMDFGLAKLQGASRLTRAGSTVGTVGYMSPEQVQGQDTDHRTDIFSLGVILYELFAGQSPFKGVHETAIIYEIVNVEAPPISPVKPDIDPELERLILECLEKDPQDRCQSAAELARNLKRLKRGSSKSRITSRVQDAVPAGASAKEEARKMLGRWKTAAIALAVLCVAAIGAAGFFMTSSKKAPDLAAYRYTPFETDGNNYGARWSPDGKSIAYTRAYQGSVQLRLRTIASPRSTVLATLDGLGNLHWAADGNSLYFTSAGKLRNIGLAGGSPKEVMPTRTSYAGVSPDDKHVAFWAFAKDVDTTFGDSSTVFISSTNGASPRRYLPDPFKYPGEFGPDWIKFSPDGSKIGLAIYGLRSVEFWILPWPDGPDAHPKKVFENRKFLSPPFFQWLPDSRRIVLNDQDDVWIADTEDGTIRRLTTSPFRQFVSSPSPDGKRLVIGVSTTNYDIVELPFDGSPLRPIMATAVNEYSATLSADGSLMAYLTEKSGKPELWLEDRAGNGRPVVTPADFPTDKGEVTVASISPDGRRIAFVRNGDFSMWLSNAEGGKPIRLFPDTTIIWMNNQCWSPDGQKIFFRYGVGDTSYGVIVPIGSGDTVHLPDSAGSFGLPAWSPDGKWIAMKQNKKIRLVSPDGKTFRTIVPPVNPSSWRYCMAWSRDSRKIYVGSSVEKTSQLHVIDIETGQSRKIADYGYDVWFGQGGSQSSTASLSADGKGLVVTATVSNSSLYFLDGALEE